MKDVVIGLLAGMVVAILGSYPLGYTAAFTAPTTFLQGFEDSRVALLLWDCLMVQMPAFGILLVATGLLLGYWRRSRWWQLGLLLAAGELLYIYLVSPWWAGLPLGMGEAPWWHQAHLVVVMLLAPLGPLLALLYQRPPRLQPE
ncbi:hypothetical protein [Gallaecimonas xiamenensis]|uniref:Uncharacterized protein n=1 Tax=Gallaecimonas xiamenensis 3-C-1 TaxID=745411 RepID=K2K8T7_9GAMM|nr:hypothetical protein [Gallaecimonas xiamenensis]EKE73665.1 hypothetical protein B3C1_09717 [Gallaecimonas xiamenensis 3-C-1]